MKRQIPITFVLAAALLIAAVVTYMVLIAPKRAESARLDEEIAMLEAKVAAAKAAAKTKQQPQIRINVADLFRLAKAMPDEEDMAGIVLEINSIASSAGIRFMAIQPQAPVVAGSHRAVPIALTFEGNYYDLNDFLYRLRNLVTVKDGELAATGRLYTLDALDLHEAQDAFPQIEAVLTVTAYAFGPGAAAATPGAPAQAPTTGTGTTETSTTGATETTESGTSGETTSSSEDASKQAAGGP